MLDVTLLFEFNFDWILSCYAPNHLDQCAKSRPSMNHTVWYFYVYKHKTKWYPDLTPYIIDLEKTKAGLTKIPYPMEDPSWSILLKVIWWWCDDAKEYWIVQHESWDMANTWVLTTAWIWKNNVNLIIIFNSLFTNAYKYTRYTCMCRNDWHWSYMGLELRGFRFHLFRFQLNQFHYH